jgi:hypothetical protein
MSGISLWAKLNHMITSVKSKKRDRTLVVWQPYINDLNVKECLQPWKPSALNLRLNADLGLLMAMGRGESLRYAWYGSDKL